MIGHEQGPGVLRGQRLEEALGTDPCPALEQPLEVEGAQPDVFGNLRQVGLGPHLERSVLQINRVAEETAPGAKPVFIKAITSNFLEIAITQ